MIEKLQRFCAMSDEHGRSVPASNGDYVLYSAARAREDALLEALKECEIAWVEGTPIEGAWAETIRQIEETR